MFDEIQAIVRENRELKQKYEEALDMCERYVKHLHDAEDERNYYRAELRDRTSRLVEISALADRMKARVITDHPILAPVSELQQTGGCCLEMYRAAGGMTDGRACPYHQGYGYVEEDSPPCGSCQFWSDNHCRYYDFDIRGDYVVGVCNGYSKRSS